MKRIGLFLLISMVSVSMAAAEVFSVNGFPVNTGASIGTDIVLVDLNGDGKKEIVAAPDNRMIYAFLPDGSLFFNYTAGTLISDLGRIPALSDFDDDGKPELVVYGNPGIHYSYLHYVNSSGSPVKEVLVGMNVVISSPAVTKDKIVLVGVSPGNPAPPSGASGVYAFDASGKTLWYLDTGWVSRYSAVAVGDIDGDGYDEAGVRVDNGVSDYRVVVLKVERTGGRVLWEKNVGGRISGVTFADMDGDGKKDVIIGSKNGVFVWNGTGALIWNNSAPSTTHSVPAVGDINGDGVMDVVVGSDQQKSLYAISRGAMMPGFPVATVQSVWSRPALGDLDGDGRMDIAAGDFGGYLYAWDSTGRPLDGFPFVPAFEPFMSGARIDDIDNDGIAEFIIGNNNGKIYALTTKLKDSTPPVTTDNTDSMWHNSDIRVHLFASDDASGVAGTYHTTDGSLPTLDSSTGKYILITGEGTNIIKYFSIDNAGNREEVRTARAYIDRTPPSSYLGTGDGWYGTPVTVIITASDALSGVASISYMVDSSLPYVSYSAFAGINLSTEGIHTIEYSSADNANNAEQVKNAAVKLDFTAPALSVGSPGAGNYLHSDIIVLNFSGTDGLSGVSSLNATIDGIQVENAQVFDMLGLPAGSHVFSVRASDAAGNAASGSVSFRVISNIDSLAGLTGRAVGEGWISSGDTAGSLMSKLASAKQKIEAGQKEKASNMIKAYINEVEAQTGKNITPEGARILTTEAAYAYITNFS